MLLPDLMPPADDTTPPVVALHGRILSVEAPDPSGVAQGLPPVPTARVVILDGQRQGEVLDAQIEGPGGSQLIGDYKPGDEVVVSITRNEDGSAPYIAVADRWRVFPLGGDGRPVRARGDRGRRLAWRPGSGRPRPHDRDHPQDPVAR